MANKSVYQNYDADALKAALKEHGITVTNYYTLAYLII